LSSPWLPLAVGAYAAAMVCSLIAVLPGGFEETRPRSLLDGLWLYPPDRAAAELVNNRVSAFEWNETRLHRMVFLVRLGVVLAVFAAILSTLHLTRGDRTDVEKAPSAAGACPGSQACGSAP